MTAIRSEAGPAVLSQDRRYRYTLTRVWDEELPTINFIGLNPSTADESALDPTLRRCLRFAHDWGFGAFVVTNLFAYRATDPLDMKRALEPVGEHFQDFNQNDVHLLHEARTASRVVACWGTHGHFKNRDQHVRRILQAATIPLYVFGLSKHGFPVHPLYQSSETKLKLWPYE
jgi:hypothetical protein